MKILIFLYLLIHSFVCQSQLAPRILANANFETGGISQGIFLNFQYCPLLNPNSAEINDSFQIGGNKALKVLVTTSQQYCADAYRSMVYIPGSDSWVDFYTTRIGFTTYSPPWQGNDIANELIFQMHIPASTGNPVIAFWLSNGLWRMNHTYDTINWNDGGYTQKFHDMGYITNGVKDRWVVMADFKIDPTGFIKIWRNGVLVVDLKGANYNKMGTGLIMAEPYFSAGMYKIGWTKPAGPRPIPERTMYLDDILIGAPNATYDDLKGDVAPPTPEIIRFPGRLINSNDL